MAADPLVPRILLFGHPGSGKSSLLGALCRAGETQGETLGAEVSDPSGRLARIRDHLYAGGEFHNTHTEIVPYEIHLRPWRIGSTPVMEPLSAVILDCDGAAANALLKHPDPITEREVRGRLASAVVQADLIALVVNAGADDRELDEAFDELAMFLERVHGRKAFEREVGGFPVFLVLAQCDRLAAAGDSPQAWEAAIQKRLRHAVRKFADFLDESEPDAAPFLPFGSVELKGYAVAVRGPSSPEPFGAAAMFRDAFAAAKQHRDRVRQSQRRLRRMAASVVAAIGLLLGGAAAVEWFQPQPSDPALAEQVQSFWDREPPAAVRLAAKNLARNRRLLEGFRNDPGFINLPANLRDFVNGRLRELDEYQAYAAKLEAVPGPSEDRSLEELDRCEARLNGELALPSGYTWGETEAGQLRDKWLADIPLIRTAEAAWQDWYRGLVNEALALTHADSFGGDWRERIAAVESAAAMPPFDADAPLPGSRSVPQPRGGAVTYRIPAEFDRVYQASRDWEFARSRLLNLRDLAAALGLTAEMDRRVLMIPPQGTESANWPGKRLKELAALGDSPTARQLANFPEPGRTLLAAKLQESLDNGVRQARRRIAEKLTGDSPEACRELARALDEPAIRDWGRLLQRLLQLRDPRAGDPVEELAAFLRTPEFKLEVQRFDLAIPLALRVPVLQPDGLLKIAVTHANAPPTEANFKTIGEATPQGVAAIYQFVPEKAVTILYRPGDTLAIELPVRSGKQRFQLAWNGPAPRSYQFDKLWRQPSLLPAKGAAEPATGVKLVPAAGSAWPRLPLLWPRQ